MDEERPGFDPRGTPAMREAVRAQVVVHGVLASQEIAWELGLPHAAVVRVLMRFAAVGALATVPSPEWLDAVEVVPGSPTDRFRDLAAPLW